MTHAVLVLPRSGKPRVIGPFDSEGAAAAWVGARRTPDADYLVQPMETPSPHTYGAHARVPLPYPRVEPGQLLPGQGALRGPEAAIVRTTDPARYGTPVAQWVEGDAYGRTASFHGLLALLNIASTDGRVLVTNPNFMIGHFASVPIPVMVTDGRGQIYVVGVVERVALRGARLEGFGRLSLTALQVSAPDLFRRYILNQTEDGLLAEWDLIPCSIGVGHGEQSEKDGRTVITGDWHLREIAIGTEPVWPGVGLELDDFTDERS